MFCFFADVGISIYLASSMFTLLTKPFDMRCLTNFHLFR